MKVAMLVPMGPDGAIGDVMVQAIPALTAHWELEVWCPEEASYRPCPVPVRPYAHPDTEVLKDLALFDLVVYVLGDSPRHSRILPVAQRLPGLVVLHDAALTNLIRHSAVEQNELDDLIERVAASTGVDDARIMRDPDRAGGDDEWLRYCARVPLTEIATEGSLGVVVHSWWHSRRVDGSLLGDVTVAPLPVPSAELGFTYDESNTTSAMLDDLDDNALLVVTVGAVNANRRVDLLLEAMADDPVLAGRIHLWAVGAAGNGAANGLLQLAGSLGLQDRFVITGRVSDGMLGEILARADIAAALRDPVLEGQSASVLTQLLAGIPVVVFDHAHYSELPDEVAEKVDPEDALAGVGRALRVLVDDEAGRIRRGDLAREFVLRTRSGAAYAAALLEAGDRALATKPMMHLTSDIGTLLKRLDLHQDEAVVDKVSDIAFELYDLA